MLDKSTLPHDPKVVEMKDIIHSDEKWFNGTKKNKTMYVHPDEDDPHRTVQNKNVIHKVMFYSSVAKPRFDDEGRRYFDGKLGIWPFVREVQIFVNFLLWACKIIFDVALIVI
jgi:hypothetical protein